MVMVFGCFSRISPLTHWSSVHPSGRFGSPSARTLRMYSVMSIRSPSMW